MAKVARRLAVELVIALASMSVGCGGGSNGASAGGSDAMGGSNGEAGSQTTLDAGGTDGTTSGGPDGSSSGAEASMEDSQASSTDGSVSDATSPLSEPSYLRTDVKAAFAFSEGFGSPYDSILATPIQTQRSAINPGFSTTQVAGQTGGTTSFTLAATSSDLYSALGISASLSVSTGLVSASAKTSFATSTRIDSTDLWAVVDSYYLGPTTQIVSPTLSAQAASMSPEQFFAAYGDRYAAEIITGAEMFCTLQIHTSSQEDKTDLSISLGLSYGASSASGTFTMNTVKAIGSHQTTVNCNYLGFTPSGDAGIATDLNSLLNAANAFQAGNESTLGNVSTSALYLIYTSYYGLSGYPGVPAGAAARVTQQAQLASDYLLYNSLVQSDFSPYYGDPSYSGKPFFTDLKAYRDGLSTYLTAALNTSSLNPGVAVPALASDGAITNWTTTQAFASTSGAPQYTVYELGNGILPKTISDYGIPLRYAYLDTSGNGTLKGTTFGPVQPVPTIGTAKSVLSYPLYLTANKNGTGTGPWLEYQWDRGTYFLPNVTDASNAPSAPLVHTATSTFGLQGNVGAQYLVVNKATGFVLTDNGGSNNMTATHAQIDHGANSVTSSQLWEFYVDDGNTHNCSSYVAPGAGSTPASGCSTSGNGVSGSAPCGSMVYAISGLHTGYWEATGPSFVANGGGGCDYCNWSCTGLHCPYSGCGGGPVPNDTFFLEPFDTGTTQAIYNFQGSNGGATYYMVTDLSQIATNPDSTSVVGGGNMIGGYGNDLWVFIPAANVDTSTNP